MTLCSFSGPVFSFSHVVLSASPSSHTGSGVTDFRARPQQGREPGRVRGHAQAAIQGGVLQRRT